MPTTEANDHLPLTRGEVLELVQQARNLYHRDDLDDVEAEELISIQIRLGQGIPGLVTPHELEGSAFTKQVRLDQMFVEELSAYTASEVLTDKIMAIYRS